MTQRNPTRPFLIGPLCIAAFLLGLTCATTAWAQVPNCDSNAKLAVGSATAMSGLVEVELRGSSLCPVTGFALAIGYDKTRLAYVRVEAGQFLTEYAGNALEVLDSFSNSEGFMTLGVILDFSAFLEVLPTAIPDDTLLTTLTFEVLPNAPVGPAVLSNETLAVSVNGRLFANEFTTENLAVHPVLESGIITIGQPQTYSMSLDAVVGSEIALQLTGSSSKSLRAFSASLTIDPSILAVVSVDPSKLTDEAFAGTVWEGSLISDVTLGDGTIEIQAFRSSAVAPGVDLPFLNLTLEILSCAGATSIIFEDRGVAANQFVDGDFGTHGVTTDLAVEDITIPLGGGGASGFVRGNADGGTIDPADTTAAVDLADAIFLLKSLFMGGQQPPCADAADVNDDGRHNLLDPIWIIQYLIGNLTLPGPFTQPGDDPTDDALGCETPPKSNCV